MQIIHPPVRSEPSPGAIALFLGGSIELGAATDWQARLIALLADAPYADRLVIYNPRRPDWDGAIPTDNPDHPVFRAQVEWELWAQDRADQLLYYFAADTVAPITLFELGLFYARAPVIGAEAGYKRYGNLVVTAEHCGWAVHTGWDAFVGALDARLSTLARA